MAPREVDVGEVPTGELHTGAGREAEAGGGVTENDGAGWDASRCEPPRMGRSNCTTAEEREACLRPWGAEDPDKEECDTLGTSRESAGDGAVDWGGGSAELRESGTPLAKIFPPTLPSVWPSSSHLRVSSTPLTRSGAKLIHSTVE